MLKTLEPPRLKPLKVGPADNGRSMTLEDFNNAIGKEGHIYELNKGIIEVTNIPHRRHIAQCLECRNQLIAYQLSRPEIVQAVTGSFDSKVLIESEQSERHPDLSVYLTPMPDVDEIWSVWVPEIAVEVVSESSVKRDYEDKPGEYLAFGIQEYWILDGFRKTMTVKSRYRRQWRDLIVKPNRKYATRRLPGFSLDLKRVFAMAK